MKWWMGAGGLMGGLLAVTALGGCGHEQSAQRETMTPVAQAQPTASERRPVAGHEESGGAVLRQQGTYQVPQGSYQVPEGEYFSPQGIYGTRGRITSTGKIRSNASASINDPVGITLGIA